MSYYSAARVLIGHRKLQLWCKLFSIPITEPLKGFQP
jgi:hypothetical protein